MAYSTIDKPSKYFNTVLYTGNGGTQSITGVGFQPDFTWIKERNNAHDASIMDVVRGVRKSLTPSNTEVEYTETTGLSSWDSDGFSFDGAGFDHVNTSGDSFVAWNWLASNTSGSSNTSGTISSTVSANTTSGFSIVSYTGTGANATVGHGLGVVPKMIIWKNRSVTSSWQVYHHTIPQSSGEYQALQLNLTNASAPFGTYNFMNGTAPTSTLFSLDAVPEMNGSGNSIIAYCFAEVKGFSKFGSYTGNGADDGTFVYTGFKPAFVIRKRTDSTSDWQILDNKRTTYNVIQTLLFANTNEADATASGYSCDFLSNGFKMRTSNSGNNASGGTYIYMAFADSPFVSSKGLPTTAR